MLFLQPRPQSSASFTGAFRIFRTSRDRRLAPRATLRPNECTGYFDSEYRHLAYIRSPGDLLFSSYEQCAWSASFLSAITIKFSIIFMSLPARLTHTTLLPMLWGVRAMQFARSTLRFHRNTTTAITASMALLRSSTHDEYAALISLMKRAAFREMPTST